MGQEFEVLHVCMPAKAKARYNFLENVALTMPSGWPVVITGDFNCAISEAQHPEGRYRQIL